MDRSRPTVRDVVRAVVTRAVIANGIAAALTAAAIEVSEPYRVMAEHGDIAPGWRVIASIGSALGIGALLSFIEGRRWSKHARVLYAWLEEDRQPTAAELHRVLAEARTGAFRIFRLWCVAGLVVGALFLLNDGPGRTVIAAIVATLLGGVTATSLTFLIGERATRPAMVIAFGGEAVRDAPTLSVRTRLAAAWAVGSGVPLAWIALAPLIRHPLADVPPVVLTTLLAVGGLAAGSSITYLLGRGIGGPIEAVSSALERVERGELDVTVAVDDAGELGQLEAGFNNMVKAIAERQQLHDLFGRHVGEDVARRALARGVELGGELIDVSVLFVDLIGSTAIAAERSPTDVVAMLNRFFHAVVTSADGEGGWVNKFEGDAALCIFGAPDARDDHAAAALRAARTLREALVDVDAGIGVSSGTVVAGNVGTEARYEYTVIGNPVNEAARLVEESKSHDARLFASRAAIDLAGTEAANWTSAGTFALRGIDEPVEAFVPVNREATGP